MRTAGTDVISWNGERARVGPWRGDATVAQLTPLPDGPVPSPEFVRRCMQTLADQGFRRVVTGALTLREQRGFLAAGFAVEEELHLLAHDLTDLADAPPLAPDHRLRRPLTGETAAVLAVDAAAFDPFWRLDEAGLADAVAATPHARFRVAVGPTGAVVGYAVTGRAGRRGYVQRLAVEPARQRLGTGANLLLDGLRWLRRWRVERALVNTQLQNDPALALYERTGFRREPSGLRVLAAEL